MIDGQISGLNRLTTIQLPGRLGDAKMTLLTDPRTDRRIAAVLDGMESFSEDIAIPAGDVSYEEALEYLAAMENSRKPANEALRKTLPKWKNVNCHTEVIRGVDGNEIKLFVHTPVGHTRAPCIYHIHGGAMVVASADHPSFVRIRNDIADLGLVVIGVEFRNGAGELGPYPFPAGLNDCVAGIQWVYANKDQLGIDNLILSGESGGGNLCLATALKAKQEGWLDQIDGVYAMCPYISGRYANPPPELPSLIENDGYLLDGKAMSIMVRAYDPTGEHANNPLAWPLAAPVEDLRGLPPHVISLNELDPLRDEGLAYYRKLVEANVEVLGRMAYGTVHACELSFGTAVPDIYSDLLASIANFARRAQFHCQ
ncbi:MAG: alpha/beta hydrolase fold domain-containing protein [Gammaproteobacteria bacterium]|nr:alpha/beta hydrolase fold domain-containing protein [Gammaproteobacteria bacterium]